MTCDSLLLELTRFEGCTNRLRTVFRRRRTYGYLGRGAVMNAVVIRAVRNTATDSLNVLGYLIKRYLIHNIIPFVSSFNIVSFSKEKIH